MNEHSRKPERYIKNPLQVLRGLAEMAFRAVDDNLYEYQNQIEARPYTPENYPPVTNVEAPAEREEDLLWQQDY